jgi:hypothetical protein
MCTVTLVPYKDSGSAGVRIGCNRDESITRPRALLPQILPFGPRFAILPIDPSSGGTWIAVNDAGLAFVLLNRNELPQEIRPELMSRGSIVPCLLHSDDLPSALALARDLNGDCFAPFKLIVSNRHEFAVIKGGQEPTRITDHGLLAQPVMFTSSGLGDHLVQGPRRELFETWFRHGSSQSRQIAFHQHSWPEQKHLSVCMRRQDARTVSFSLVDVGRDNAELTYYPRAPDEPCPSFSHSLRLRVGVTP